MEAVLGRFQLRNPNEFVLRAIAAAVAGNAAFFAYEFRFDRIKIRWDGMGYAREDLENLWASVSRSGAAPRLSELAIALQAARYLGEVQLSAAGGEILLQSGSVEHGSSAHGLLNLAATTPETVLTVRFDHPWKLLLGRILQKSPRSLLNSRAPLAPLQFLPPLRPLLSLVVPWAIQVGQPPHRCVEATSMDSLPETPWGKGYIYLDGSISHFIHLGVHVRPPVLASSRLKICWWTEGATLRLDLSRQSLLEDEAYQDWLHWIADTVASILKSKSSLDEAQLQCFVDCGTHSRNKDFLNAEIFARADGTATSFAELEGQCLRQGFIPYITYSAPLPWRPDLVVICQRPYEIKLLEHFPTVNLSLMCERKDVTFRLPDEEEYLVRLPFPDNSGEIALRNCLTGLHRKRSGNAWTIVENAIPRSCDVAFASKRGPYYEFSSLYLCLVERKRDDIVPEIVAAHLLNFFVLCGSAVVKSDSPQTLAVLLEPNKESMLSAPILGRKIGTSQFKSMARQCRFKCFFGPDQSLLDLYEKGGEWSYINFANAASFADPSRPHLVLPVSSLALLKMLLKDKCQFTAARFPDSYAASLTLVAALETAGEHRKPANTILAALALPTSAAKAIVTRLANFEQVSSVLERATKERDDYQEETYRHLSLLGEGKSRQTTGDFLLAFLLAKRELNSELASAGLTIEAVRLELEAANFTEVYAEIEEHLVDPGNSERSLWLLSKAFLCFSDRRNSEAADLVAELSQRFPDDSLCLYGYAYLQAMSGNWQAAADSFASLVEKAPSAGHWQVYGEVLRGSGHRAQALAASLQKDDDPEVRGNLRALQASVTDDPDEVLSLCAEARQWPDCPLSVLATEGFAYFQKGPKHHKEARRALHKFVGLRLSQCLEPDLDARQEQARRLLASEELWE